jgi:purine-binding chemotaxis protein CheW
MDFLEIRKKAKERAQARAAEVAAVPPPDRSRAPDADAGAGAADPAGGPAAAGAVLTEDDLVDAALAARLQGLPPPTPEQPTPPVEADGRFTTWRPGAGAPPPVVPGPLDVGPGAPSLAAPPLAAVAPAVAAGEDGGHLTAGVPGPEAAPALDPLDEFFYRPDEAAPAVPQLAASAAEPGVAPASLVREEYLTFLLGPEEYAVAIGRVREVIKAPPITEVPRAPAHVLGVVTVRGEVVAVVDPRRRLGLPPGALSEGEGRVVIVDAGEGGCGLLVDRVASVVRLPPGSIEPCPHGIAGQRAELLAGIGRAGERLFTVLDVAALLRRAPRADPGRAGGVDARA